MIMTQSFRNNTDSIIMIEYIINERYFPVVNRCLDKYEIKRKKDGFEQKLHFYIKLPKKIMK